MDKIRCLSMTDGQGFFIDLADCPLAFSVTPNEGDILINYLVRAVIPGKKVSGFFLGPPITDEKKLTWPMVLEYTAIDGFSKLQIGHINDRKIAGCWMEIVNELYGQRYQNACQRRIAAQTLKLVPLQVKEIRALAKIGVHSCFDLIHLPKGRLRKIKGPNKRAILQVFDLIEGCPKDWNYRCRNRPRASDGGFFLLIYLKIVR